MRKRSSTAVAACAIAVALQALPSTSGFLVPTTPAVRLPPALSHSSSTGACGGMPGLGLSRVHSRSGSFSRGVGLEGRAPATSTLAAPGRRSRRSHATRTSMVFGDGGGRGGGGGFRLDPGAIATITFGLLFVFAPGFIFGAFNTLFLVVTVGPILFSVGLNLYNKFNLVEAPCPVCGAGLQGLKNRPSQCPSCGAMLLAQNEKFEAMGTGYVRDEAGAQQEFSRMGDSGVIDVDAIDVDD